MNQTDFFEAVKTKVLEKLKDTDPKLTATIQQVTKANNIIYHGLAFKGTSNIQPVVYLDDYYDHFLSNHASLDKISDTVADIYRSSCNPEINVDFVKDFDCVKDKIIPALYNTERNKKLLKDIVHKDIFDLSIYYRIVLDIGQQEGAITITNKLLESYEITTEQLDEIAWANLRRNYPYKLSTMYDVVSGLTQDLPPKESFSDNMLILTSPCNHLGAVYMCDKMTISQISKDISDNLLFLPSSRHEIIILPGKMARDESHLEDFKTMVREVNATTVSDEDYLSDNIYYYDSKNDCLGMVP